MTNLDHRKLHGLSANELDELVHELRQPLSVIESIAYFLELTCADENVCEQVRRIQAMVVQANRILEGQSSPEAVRIS